MSFKNTIINNHRKIADLDNNRDNADTDYQQVTKTTLQRSDSQSPRKDENVNIFLKTRIINFKYRQQIQNYLRGEYYSHALRFCGMANNHKEGVKVCLSPDKQAFYSDVAKCKYRWLCPTCNSKIGAVRGEELRQAFTAYVEQGYHLHFVTLTVRHHLDQPLAEILSKINNALRQLMKGVRSFREIDQYFGTLEIKYSPFTGWHPHFHVVTVQRVHRPGVLRDIVDYWLRILPEATRSGQDVRQATHHGLSNYLTKTGLSYELTNTHHKQGDSLSPFLLIGAGYPDRFMEYMKATHKVRMNRSSRDFFKKVSVNEHSDEAAADLGEIIERVMGYIPVSTWNHLRRYHSLGDILTMAEQGHTVDYILKQIYGHTQAPPEDTQPDQASLTDPLKSKINTNF